ncbi:MAG: phosphatase PAP2 family protein [Acidobacteriota bacterium]
MLKKQISLILLLILILSFTPLSVYSVEDKIDETAVEKKNTGFFKALLEDEGEIWTAPLRFSLKDWVLVAGLSAFTGYLIANDESIYDRIKSYQGKNKWVDDLSPVITLLGDGNVSLGVSALFYASGLVIKDKKAKDTGKLVLMSLIHSGVVVQLLKHLAGRQRPEAENGIDKWDGPSGFFKRYTDNRDMFYDAFPSGHTITAWSTATVIAHQYNKSVFVPILSYGLATLSGLSRVTEDTHWLSDVFVGAVLGFAIGKFIYKKRSQKFMIMPLVGNGKTGLTIGFKL